MSITTTEEEFRLQIPLVVFPRNTSVIIVTVDVLRGPQKTFLLKPIEPSYMYIS